MGADGMSDKVKGILLAAGGGSLWGISGILAQLLFAVYTVSSEWLVSTRLLMAGILILFYSRAVKREDIFGIFRESGDVIRLLLFAVFGMVSCQYLFFKAIEVSSASLAAILQFTAPIFVYLYMLIKKEKRFNPAEGGLVLATFAGVLLIVTKGEFSRIAVSPLGLVLGIGSAIGVAFYTLQPRLILKKYGSSVVVGWGMFIGGVLFQFIHPFWGSRIRDDSAERSVDRRNHPLRNGRRFPGVSGKRKIHRSLLGERHDCTGATAGGDSFGTRLRNRIRLC